MGSQVYASAAAFSSKNVGIEVARRSVTFHPSVWKDYFLAYTSTLTEISSHEEQELERLKDEVKKLLTVTPDDSVHKLDLIDAIQRLGIRYHFEREIKESLQYMYDTYHESGDKQNEDLHTIALRFRLLRQQGYYVPCVVFNKFKDQEGKFEESLVSNVRGLLSMYEASQYGVHGEEILEEALKFSTFHLESMTTNSREISAALEMPIHKSLTRVEMKKFLPIYQEDKSHDNVLLKFAIMDFNLLQKMHQREINEITRWWKALELCEKLPFTRDRVVERYFWILAVYFEPQYSLARKILTKVIAMTSIIDDIYDNYGTLDELVLFTDAIESWNINAVDTLPSYMKYFYKSLLDVHVSIEEELGKIGQTYRIDYAIKELKKLVWAYLEEAKWTYSGYVPTMEEYMKVGLVTAGYMLLSTTALVGIQEHIPKEAFDWISSEPLLVRASSVICRLSDDLVGQEFEKKITAVDSYMKEKGVSKEETLSVLRKEIINAWKDINQECLSLTTIPKVIIDRVINITRVIDLLYQEEDAYTNSNTKLKSLVTSVLIEPVAI
uniref:Terpene synthase 1 n=1 Tax=Jasminum sambac TaxID=660624 RepID=A0A8T9EDQ3_9LAMI|nr:terpene synthase 1 [Jasminum sambac]